jgi:hypothetical protein
MSPILRTSGCETGQAAASNSTGGNGLGVWGCIALGVIVGLIAGLIAGISFESAVKTLRSRARAFPKAEVSALIGLVVFVTGGNWAGSQLVTFNDPRCTDVYFVAMCALTIAAGILSFMHLVKYRAQADARRHP